MSLGKSLFGKSLLSSLFILNSFFKGPQRQLSPRQKIPNEARFCFKSSSRAKILLTRTSLEQAETASRLHSSPKKSRNQSIVDRLFELGGWIFFCL